jgi:acetoin utilization deacetylase AcuC-like enzyme
MKEFWPIWRPFENNTNSLLGGSMIFYNDHASTKGHLNLEKPGLLKGLIPEKLLTKACPLSLEDLALAHSQSFVNGVLLGDIENGFCNTRKEIAQTMPFLSGNLFAAAVESLLLKNINISLGDGGHHAKYELADDYCTINHLIVVAQKLKKLGIAQRIGILDYDFHYGDGTNQIIRQLGLDFIKHYSCGRDYFDKDQGKEFIHSIPLHLDLFSDCDILLYHSGADTLLGDRNGGYLSLGQFKMREQAVITLAQINNLPLAICFGGGYRDEATEVLDAHMITINLALAA